MHFNFFFFLLLAKEFIDLNIINWPFHYREGAREIEKRRERGRGRMWTEQIRALWWLFLFMFYNPFLVSSSFFSYFKYVDVCKNRNNFIWQKHQNACHEPNSYFYTMCEWTHVIHSIFPMLLYRIKVQILGKQLVFSSFVFFSSLLYRFCDTMRDIMCFVDYNTKKKKFFCPCISSCWYWFLRFVHQYKWFLINLQLFLIGKRE